MGKANTVANAIAALRGEINARQDEIRELEAQRLAVANATPAREDLFQAVDTRLHRDAEKYRASLANALHTLSLQPLQVDTRLGPDHGTYDIDLLALATGPHGRGPGPEGVSGPCMSLLLNDVLKEGLHRVIEGFLADKNEGLPLAARRDELRRLDNIIEVKRGELAAMVAEAAAAGVTLTA